MWKGRYADVLGMNVGTATGRVKKELMFRMASALGMDLCYRCGERIESSDQLSVDHKVEWVGKANARELFFDQSNIAFSHWRCNVDARRCRPPVVCSGCGKEGISRRAKTRECWDCHVASRRLSVPAASVLAAMSSKMSNVQIAKAYGVTERSVRKWKKTYGI